MAKAVGAFSESASMVVGSGGFAVFVGLVVSILLWLTIAHIYKPLTAANYVSRLNYIGLRQRLDHLRIRVEHAHCERCALQDQSGDTSTARVQNQAHARALRECDEIEEGLEGKGMPWVTGLGYIELWRRVHRAEESLIKIEPYSEVIEGAMRDHSRLLNATMKNKETLQQCLKEATPLLAKEASFVGKYLSASGPEQSNVNEKAQEKDRATPEQRAEALTVLSGVRYEINNFRDNAWEGLVQLRNGLADTVVLLGLAAYVLLAFAIFVGAPRDAIIWAVTYFLIGAIAGLFARAQAEWGADTAIDDFGLSKTKLLQIPWLAGLAAVGGVLVTSILDPQNPDKGSLDLSMVFSERPILLFIAAIFGVTPSLLMRRLDPESEKSKEDLQSTQTSQSTEISQSRQYGGQRSSSGRQMG